MSRREISRDSVGEGIEIFQMKELVCQTTYVMLDDMLEKPKDHRLTGKNCAEERHKIR